MRDGILPTSLVKVHHQVHVDLLVFFFLPGGSSAVAVVRYVLSILRAATGVTTSSQHSKGVIATFTATEDASSTFWVAVGTTILFLILTGGAQGVTAIRNVRSTLRAATGDAASMPPLHYPVSLHRPGMLHCAGSLHQARTLHQARSLHLPRTLHNARIFHSCSLERIALVLQPICLPLPPPLRNIFQLSLR